MASNVSSGQGLPTVGQVYKDPKSGQIFTYIATNNGTSGTWATEADVNSTPELARYKAGIDSYKSSLNTDSNALAAANLDVLAPTTFMDNPIAQLLPLSEDFYTQKNRLQREAANPTGMAEQDTAVNALKRGLGETSQQALLREKLNSLMNTGRDNQYETDMYDSVANKLKREAALLQQQNASDLASRGLGMSTIVNDVNSVVQRDLMGNLQDAASKASVAAEDLRRNYIQDAISKAIGLENNVIGQGQTAASNIANIGNQKANIFNNAQNSYNSALTYQDANAASNLKLQNDAWNSKINNLKYFIELPFAVNNSGNAASSNATNASTAQYQTQVQASNNDNNIFGNLLGTGLTMAFGKKK